MCAECSWQDVLANIEQALEQIPDLPERAEDFANSVDEKLCSIHEWITENEHVTEPQETAVANMIAAIDRWLE